MSEARTIQLRAQRIWHEVASRCMHSTVSEDVSAICAHSAWLKPGNW
jgi:hypothetical protein